MKEKAKTVLLVLLAPKFIILGMAAANFVILWLDARRWEESGLLCYLCPWYYPWSYTNVPTRLLLAACCLCLGTRWGYLAAMGVSSLTFFQGIFFNVTLYRDGAPFKDWVEIWLANPTFHAQFVLAGIIFVSAAVCFRKAVIRRSSSNV